MVEVNESYFLLRFVLQLPVEGAKRVRGKHVCGAENVCVFTSLSLL
ncbi:hypothetical protein [Campylobacter troglodytis]|nr:hypothetical protein [Campylobacter troglodytis]